VEACEADLAKETLKTSLYDVPVPKLSRPALEVRSQLTSSLIMGAKHLFASFLRLRGHVLLSLFVPSQRSVSALAVKMHSMSKRGSANSLTNGSLSSTVLPSWSMLNGSIV
jgi:hypothetical protein